MDWTKQCLYFIAGMFVLFFTVSCTGLRAPQGTAKAGPQTLSVEQDGSLLAKYAPVFILDEADKNYNRIGTPAVRDNGAGDLEIYIDTLTPTIYSLEQTFKTERGEYTNLIYRVHFERTPFRHLTGGRNVGLLMIVTLDQKGLPLLITTVHTCGCYLAFIPTSNLPANRYPESWSVSPQDVYGERLPGLISLEDSKNSGYRFALRIKSGTHRIAGLSLLSEDDILLRSNVVTAALQPMKALRELPFGKAEVSFFETEGARKGYVRNSQKPLERLLMSWWLLDWRVGEDKDLGPKELTGTVFYTSLKPWARGKSDLWDFENFLQYWGWKF
ncbi:MAG: hypothetical protein OQK50_06150 [Deltaproteobacteria bacterium]|jgi:hypothetical protein|nr:hypothetical protein [Deltaproteobacteria bacterium]MCW9049892.1 hypothetical protein [Deltaproteobacteria bacterium]